MGNDFKNWEQINPELVAIFNHHLAIIEQKLQERIELCPIVAFLDNGEIKSYIRNIKDPKDYPKMSDIYKLVRGVKDSTNIFAVMIAYTQKNNNGNFIAIELEHKSGDCIKIMIPIITTGVFHRKNSIAVPNKYVVKALERFVWTD